VIARTPITAKSERAASTQCSNSGAGHQIEAGIWIRQGFHLALVEADSGKALARDGEQRLSSIDAGRYQPPLLSHPTKQPGTTSDVEHTGAP
jgi:hypothetical protein